MIYCKYFINCSYRFFKKILGFCPIVVFQNSQVVWMVSGKRPLLLLLVFCEVHIHFLYHPVKLSCQFSVEQYCWVTSFVADLIISGVTFVAWLTTSRPAYAKSYLFKKPVCLFRLQCIFMRILFTCCYLLFFSTVHEKILIVLVSLQEIQ